MDRSFSVPSRPEMEAGLASFAERAGVRVRYGCRWEATRREEDGFVLATTDGDYRCRAAVFALGVTQPWKPDIAGIEDVPHYAETSAGRDYRGKKVFVIGKRNSAFEVADGLLPWARQIVLASPRPVETSVLAVATVTTRYLQPLEDDAIGGGTFALDAAIERVERTSTGYRVHGQGTTHPGQVEVEADEAIAATGFAAPLGDLPRLGVATVAQGRIPALTPFWESMTVPGIYFAGNASQGSPGLRKHGVSSASTAVRGFRYNARVLARRIAEERFSVPPERRPLAREAVASFLASELARAPELWTQKAYLARVVAFDGGDPHDAGVEPLTHFLDAAGPNALAATVETNARGEIYPVVYSRRRGAASEHPLPGDELNRFDSPDHRAELEALVGRVAGGRA